MSNPTMAQYEREMEGAWDLNRQLKRRNAELEKEMDGICLAVLNNRGKSVTERTLVRVRGVVDKFNLPLNIL